MLSAGRCRLTGGQRQDDNDDASHRENAKASVGQPPRPPAVRVDVDVGHGYFTTSGLTRLLHRYWRFMPQRNRKCAHSSDKSMVLIRTARPTKYRMRSKAGCPFRSKPADRNLNDQIYPVILKVRSRSFRQLRHRRRPRCVWLRGNRPGLMLQRPTNEHPRQITASLRNRLTGVSHLQRTSESDDEKALPLSSRNVWLDHWHVFYGRGCQTRLGYILKTVLQLELADVPSVRVAFCMPGRRPVGGINGRGTP